MELHPCCQAGISAVERDGAPSSLEIVPVRILRRGYRVSVCKRFEYGNEPVIRVFQQLPAFCSVRRQPGRVSPHSATTSFDGT
jgi:hypothetical protein